MKFLVDAQLPPGLCAGLRKRGHEGVHVADILEGAATDAEVARFAAAEGMILITKDDDFAMRHRADRLQIVWLRIGNAANRALIDWLDPRWDSIESALREGEALIEVV